MVIDFTTNISLFVIPKLFGNSHLLPISWRGMVADLSWMKHRYDELVEQGLDWNPPTLESANAPRCNVDGSEMIMLSANNYLNLTTHPKVVTATIEATRSTVLDQAQ